MERAGLNINPQQPVALRVPARPLAQQRDDALERLGFPERPHV
jgi:hypothetical protein